MERRYRYVTTGYASCSPAETATESELRRLVRTFPGTHFPCVEVVTPEGFKWANPETIDRICEEHAMPMRNAIADGL